LGTAFGFGDTGHRQSGSAHMTPSDTDELGPVDYVVVEFPPDASNFTGEMAAELDKLLKAGTIRILDLIILAKGTTRARCAPRRRSWPACSPKRTSTTWPRP
jgi:hypothetical protein